MKKRTRKPLKLLMTMMMIEFLCKGINAASEEDVNLARVNRLLCEISAAEQQVQRDVLRYRQDLTRVIVLGDVGSGKSTLVHALVKRTADQARDIPIEARGTRNGYQMVINPEHKLPGFQRRDGGSAAVKTPTSYLDRTNNIIYWDCPGFTNSIDNVKIACAIEQLFGYQNIGDSNDFNCNIKILFTIDYNSLQADRGHNIIQRFKILKGFFQRENDLNQAVSIVVTKQRWQGEQPDPASLFDENGLKLIGDERYPAVEIGLTQDELEWTSSFLTGLKIQGRIFAFPEPRGTGAYDYDWFPDRQNIINELVNLERPIRSPRVNILASFAQKQPGIYILETKDGMRNAARLLTQLFQNITRTYAGNLEFAPRVQETMEYFDKLEYGEVNRPKKIAQQLSTQLYAFIREQDRTLYARSLDDLFAQEAYVILFDKLDPQKCSQECLIHYRNISDTFRKEVRALLDILQRSTQNNARPRIIPELTVLDFEFDPNYQNIIMNAGSKRIEHAILDNIELPRGAQFHKEYSETVQEYDSFRFGFKEAIGVSTKTTIEGGIPLIGGAKTELGLSLNFEANQEKTASTTKSRNIKFSLTLNDPGSYKVAILANKLNNVRIPYSARVIYKGYLDGEFKVLTKDLDALEHEVRCRGCNVPLTQDPIRSVLTGMVTGSLEVDTLHQFNIQAKVL